MNRAAACLVAVIALPGLGSAVAARREPPGPQTQYKGHRALVWVVDQETGELRGWAEAFFKPGDEQKVEPAKGYAMRFTAGPLGKSEFFDERGRSWEEPTVSLTTRYSSGSSERVLDLTNAYLGLDYDTKGKVLASIAVLAPVGSLRSEALAGRLSRQFQGELAELEELLIAGAAEGQFDADEVTDVYVLLRKTGRKEQWAELMKSGDARGQTTASAALSMAGDAEAQEKFADRCRAARGNEQVHLLMVLGQMPQSDVLLKAILDLMVAPGGYRIRMSRGAAAADEDRRYNLFTALLKYPRKDLEPYAGRLRDWAKGPGKQFETQVGKVLERGPDRGAPTP